MCSVCRQPAEREDEAFTIALIREARETGRSIDEVYETWRNRSASLTGSEPTSPA